MAAEHHFLREDSDSETMDRVLRGVSSYFHRVERGLKPRKMCEKLCTLSGANRNPGRNLSAVTVYLASRLELNLSTGRGTIDPLPVKRISRCERFASSEC